MSYDHAAYRSPPDAISCEEITNYHISSPLARQQAIPYALASYDKECVPMLHAYRLVYRESPHAPEMLWEWEEPYIQMLIENARTFHRGVVQCYFPTWEDLAQENQCIW